MNSLLKNIFQLRRTIKTILQVFSDFILICFTFFLSMYLRLDSIEFAYTYDFWFTLILVAPITLIFFFRLEFYKTIIRYISYHVLKKVFYGIAFSSFSILLISQSLNLFVPRSVPFIYFAIMIILISGIRFSLSILYHKIQLDKRKNVAIYGAGEAGRQLLNFLKNSNDYKPLFFLDDNKSLISKNIMGLVVYSFEKATFLLKKNKVSTILLAMPSLSPSVKQKIINKLEILDLEIKSIPNLTDLLSNKNNFLDLKTVSIEEIIGREPITPIEHLLKPNIKDKVVMVTGAGGSIGAELCRQILVIKPKNLIILDNSEYNLYKIEKTLIELNKNKKIQVIPIIASVQDEKRIENILKIFKIQTIYHAAAYKHVPLIEQNITEGIKTNIFGTHILVKKAIKFNVENFILISSDKAVNPTNYMGATKRISEIICLTNQEFQQKTKFCIVRFGNVLSSSGSVIPLFQEQIKKGGPITVTHKNIKRYFMTITEAAQLVIQAGAINDQGDIFILDMGEQKNVFAIAERMAKLNGYKPFLNKKKSEENANGIHIKIIGLRPGEKMFEELFKSNKTFKTVHPRIMRTSEKCMDVKSLDKLIKILLRTVEQNDFKLIKKNLIEFDKDFRFSKKTSDLTF